MFGLGWMELLIIGGVIMLFAGPVGAKKLFGSLRQLQRTKDELTGARGLDKLSKIDELLGGDGEEQASDDEGGAEPRREVS